MTTSYAGGNGSAVRGASISDLPSKLRRMYPPVCHRAADEIERLRAERDDLRAAIFGGPRYDADLGNGNFVEMAQTTEAARVGALSRAAAAEAERDA